MPNSKAGAAKNGAAAVHDEASLQDTADSMFRAAAECCRQQARLGRLLDLKCSDEELESVIEESVLCIRMLGEACERYHAVGNGSHDGLDDATWHAANGVWQAGREYTRRHNSCTVKSARMSRHSAAQLGELAIEYELKASAVLALHYAVEQYRKVRPAAA